MENNEQFLKTEQMQAAKTLADTNLKISEAKGTLFKLQEEETTYLIEREEKAVKRITDVLAKSADLFEQASGNHKKITELYQTVSSFGEFLKDLYVSVKTIITDFREKYALWEAHVSAIEVSIANKRKEVEDFAKTLEADRKDIEKKRAELVKDKAYLESQQQTLAKSYEELKRLWNKVK